MTGRFDDLLELAHTLSEEWTRAHGDPRGTASALVGPDRFAVLLEGALNRAELVLAEQSAGRALLQQYTERLLAQVIEKLTGRVEYVMGRRVLSTGVNLDPRAGWIMCFFKLGEQTSPG
jgi:uncharacterized protein YbcI